MKTRVLIIEDNAYKQFTTKQVLEAKLRLPVKTASASTGAEFAAKAAGVDPDTVFFRPEGGIAGLLAELKKRGTNRRNTEVTILLAQDLEEGFGKKFQSFVKGYSRRQAQAA